MPDTGTNVITTPLVHVVPKCAVCGALITGVHSCVPPFSTTSAPMPGSIRLTPWGTWEWKPW